VGGAEGDDPELRALRDEARTSGGMFRGHALVRLASALHARGMAGEALDAADAASEVFQHEGRRRPSPP
jgi:hypothetical protein